MGVASRAMEMSSSVISHSTWQVRGGVQMYIHVCGGSRCSIYMYMYMFVVVVHVHIYTRLWW